MAYFDTQPPQLDTIEGLYEYLKRTPTRPAMPSEEVYLRFDAAERTAFNAQRLDYIGSDLVLRTTSMEAIVSDIWATVVRNRRKAVGRHGVMISGESGMGKTTTALAAIKYTFARYRAEMPDWESNNRIPVLLIDAPPSGSGKAVVKRFADFLQLPRRRNDTLESLESLVVAELNAAGTRLIVVDEMQNIATRSPGNGQSVDVLKGLSNRIAATFVYAGIEIHNGQLLEGPRGRQVKNRFHPFVMRPFNIANDDSWKSWHGLIRSFERELCLFNHRPGDLSDDARYLFDNSAGSIGNLSEWLTSAATRLIMREVAPDEERLGRELLEELKPIIEDDAA